MELVELSQQVDDQIERCMRQGDDIGTTLEHVIHKTFEYLPVNLLALRIDIPEQRTFSVANGNNSSPDNFETWLNQVDERTSRQLDNETWIAQPLEFDERVVGRIGFAFTENKIKSMDRAFDFLFVVAEQIDDLLWQFHQVDLKQNLIESTTESLCDPMFGRALDNTANIISESLDYNEMLVFYRLATAPEVDRIHYRRYENGQCIGNSVDNKNAECEQLVTNRKHELLDPSDDSAKKLLDAEHVLREDFRFGMIDEDNLGMILMSFDESPGHLEQDLLRFTARTINQRLIDFYREWRSLSKFFSVDVINQLLSETEYENKYLAPREETSAILYADITGFTQLCEKNVDHPTHLSEFVDDWGQQVVEEIWHHRGTFDKMVGDCVIALFGPPFYDRTSGELAEDAVITAHKIQELTEDMYDHPVVKDVNNDDFPGMGVTIGINLCQVTCGMYGPDDDFTAFGTGMNETARLQSLADFRETFIMDDVYEAIKNRSISKEIAVDGPKTKNVKNVATPLRYFECQFNP